MKMKKYELMVIISSTISEAEIAKRVSGLKDLLGSEVVYEEAWGMRPFAYPIKKQTKGYYVVWNFMADTELLESVQEALKLYPDLVRHLLFIVPENYTPMKLADIEAGLEKLREEKAEKRAGRRKPTMKKAGDKADKPAPAKESADKPAEAAPKAEPAAEAPAEATPAAAEKADKPADGGKKTLDEKLDDILSDADLGL